MTDLKIVPMRGGPSLVDIPAQLRQLADLIEKGEFKAENAIAVVETTDGVETFLWGPRNDNPFYSAGLLAFSMRALLHSPEYD